MIFFLKNTITYFFSDFVNPNRHSIKKVIGITAITNNKIPLKEDGVIESNNLIQGKEQIETKRTLHKTFLTYPKISKPFKNFKTSNLTNKDTTSITSNTK